MDVTQLVDFTVYCKYYQMKETRHAARGETYVLEIAVWKGTPRGKKKTFGRLRQKFWTKTEIDLKCKG